MYTIYYACSRRNIVIEIAICWKWNIYPGGCTQTLFRLARYIDFFGTILIYYIMRFHGLYTWNVLYIHLKEHTIIVLLACRNPTAKHHKSFNLNKTWLFCLFHFVVEMGKKYIVPLVSSSHCCAEILFNFRFSIWLVPVLLAPYFISVHVCSDALTRKCHEYVSLMFIFFCASQNDLIKKKIQNSIRSIINHLKWI